MKLYSFRSFEKCKNQNDFRKVIFSGKRIKTELFNIHYLKTDNSFSKLGISVSKQTGIAVVRNKLKRICREWFRLNKRLFLEPVEIVILFRNKVAKRDYDTLSLKISESLKGKKWFQAH